MKTESNYAKTKKMTVSSLMLALTVLTLFFATILPVNRLSLYALSSFFISIVIIEYSVKAGWVFYFASSLLSLLVIQIKIRLVPYVVFFGIYGIVKFYIEKINNLILEYILKLIYFNMCLLAAYVFIEKLLFLEISGLNLPVWLIVILLEVVFIIYDYVYTLFIKYYREKLRKMIGLT